MKKGLAILNILSLIGTIVLNGLSNGKLVEGKFVGAISDSYPTLFAPAGITFSIWGIIYLFLIGFAVYQGRDLLLRRSLNMDFREQIGPWFIASNVFNMLWLFAWLNEKLGLALLLMLGLLISLTAIYTRLGVGVRKVISPVKWFVHIPFSIYLGWICVATIANASAWLVAIKWNAFGLFAEIWTGIMILVAGILGSGLGFKRKDYALRLVFLWAFTGIFLKINGLDFPEGQYLLWTIGIAMGGILVSIVLSLAKRS
ncbi:MAG: hypothetical protein MRZ79_11105 [Bacteroidia bacterium]|nr:hypothetical protein [Bacteroidia bacterium]